MNLRRRQLLAAAGGAATALAGCAETLATDSDDGGDDPVEPVDRNPDDPDPDCGYVTHSLSALLTDSTGDPEACFEGATPDLLIQNEREASVEIDVELDTENGIAESYSIDAEERVLERNAFEAHEDVQGTVTVDGGEWAVRWPERSCYRYGISIQETGVEIGWIEPITGPGDTQHDCYPWSAVDLEVGVVGDGRTVTVDVTDRCTGESEAYTRSLPADGHERIDGILESGGVYEIEADVEEGESVRETFENVCWGVTATVREDGTVGLEQLAID